MNLGDFKGMWKIDNEYKYSFLAEVDDRLITRLRRSNEKIEIHLFNCSQWDEECESWIDGIMYLESKVVPQKEVK